MNDKEKAKAYHEANKERRNQMTKDRYEANRKPHKSRYANKIDDVAMDNYIKMLEENS